VIVAYRLCSRRYAPNSGKGAALEGGRWNQIGTEVIYAASSRSLAAMEILVHYAVVPMDFVITELRIPDRVRVIDISIARLPTRWNHPRNTPDVTRRIGDPWIKAGRSCVLRVPSAVVDGEWNYVINVAHPEFRHIKFGRPEPFRFDPRLK
jgi:RES domain-containing protein